jgi:type IX secretion system PorP/SprF family membrane protein
VILNSNNIQKWLFDYFEGELTTIESKQVEQFILDNPEYHQEYIAWKDSIDEAQSDEEVPVYTGMESLMVATPIIHNFWFRSAASFAILLLSSIVGIHVWMNAEAVNSISENINSSYEIAESTYMERDKLEYIYSFNSSESTINDYSRSLSSKLLLLTSQPQLIREENKSNNFRNNSSLGFASIIQNLIDLRNYSRITFNGNVLTTFKNENTNHKVVAKKIRKRIRYKGLNHKNDDHSKRKKEKYKYLNYRNENVKGISHAGKYRDRSKPDSESNASSISERFKEGKPEKKKQSLKSKLQYMELGLENINDPIFIADNSHPLFINPSLTGQIGYTRLKTTYRNQYFNETNNGQIGMVSFDTYLNNLKAGIGFQSLYIHLDNFDYNTYNFNYAQKIEINRSSSLSVGTTFSLEKLRHNGQAQGLEINPTRITNLPSAAAHIAQFNLGMSAWYSGKMFYGGINVTNLLNPTLYASQESNTYMNQLNYSAQIGTDYKRSAQSNTVVSPYAVYNNMDDSSELWTGVSIRHKAIILGLGGSTKLSAKAIIGVQSHSFRISYSYDLTNSTIKNAYIGSHDLSLRFLLSVEKNANILDY